MATGLRKIRDIWPEETKSRALTLYIEQSKPSVTDISTELGVPLDTIKYWQAKEGWVKKRNSALAAVREVEFQSVIGDITEQRRQAFKDFKTIRDKAVEALKDTDLEFRDTKQAADTLNMAIKGMDEILDRGIPLLFLQEVAEIILDEIDDEEVRQRLGTRLINLGQLWSTSRSIN